MGHGIALTLARAGHTVAITDPMAEARAAWPSGSRPAWRRWGWARRDRRRRCPGSAVAETTAEAVAGADFVFEAAPEKMALKQAIFAEIEAHAPDACVLASNTSVMPITRIMSGLTADRAARWAPIGGTRRT